jgi:hypothetical protein
VSSNLAGMLRMPSMRQRIVPLLWHPLVVGTAVLYFLFWHSSITRNPSHDLFQLGHDRWLSVYYTLLWTLLVYYCGVNAWVALRHLRGDPRAKPVALTWLVCIGLGALAMLGWLMPWLGLATWCDYGRIVMCASVVAFSVASARSWQRKLDQWRDLIRVTGARLWSRCGTCPLAANACTRPGQPCPLHARL